MSSPDGSEHVESRENAAWNYDTPEADGVEYLNDEQQVYEPYSDDLGKNVAVSGEPYVCENNEDYLAARIRRMDEERAATVAKRRQTHNCPQRWLAYVIPYGGITSSGFNLASSSIGAGIIALPSAFHTSGMIMALIYLFVISSLTIYSHTLLARAAFRTGLRNYEEIVRELMGPVGAYFLAFCLWFLSFGGEISYTISFRDALLRFLESSSSTPEFLRTPSGERLLLAALWLVFMLPLTIPKEINSLRYFSVLAISFIIFFVICMVVHSCQTLHDRGLRSDYVYFMSGNKAIDGLGIFMFAFINQLNSMEVAREQYKPSVKRMTLSATLATCLCLVLYIFAGVFGYLDFGSAVASTSALKLYDPIKQPLFGVCYVGIMFKLCVGYGMHMIPVRDATYFFAGTDVHKVSYLVNTIVVVFWATFALIASMFIPRVTVVFSLVGGFAGGFIGFIFPALMYMYTGNWTLRSVGWFDYLGTYFLLIVGVIGVVFGTASAIAGEVNA